MQRLSIDRKCLKELNAQFYCPIITELGCETICSTQCRGVEYVKLFIHSESCFVH